MRIWTQMGLGKVLEYKNFSHRVSRLLSLNSIKYGLTNSARNC